MSNNFEINSIVKIGDLTKEYNFFVPSYQRGYRWTTEEVKSLLEDLYDFYVSRGHKESDMYCLQPLMVKLRSDDSGVVDSYEVIDGQQRLTTVYIVLNVINNVQGRVFFELANKENIFSIKYETRKDSEEYLKQLDMNGKPNHSNIDYYYFSNTVKTFLEWLNRDTDVMGRLTAISTMLKKKTFFIWYELPKSTKQSELFELFKKVNIGKIQLTDGELIKALLINKDNFKENAEKRQEEIAVSWDRIEQGLREDDFWYFFNKYKENDDRDTRIDIIFELLARKISKSENYMIPEEEKRFTFLVISRYIESNKQNREEVVTRLWQEVEFVYAELRFWYKKNDLYHIIGYLIETKQRTIFEIWDSIADKRKTEQLNLLLDSVKKSVGYGERFKLEDFEYKSMKRDYIRNLLLLHNIATIVIKKDNEVRFPFDIMKKRKWDIEHIHAINDDTEEVDNGIANLALLDAKINREYKDAPYSKKRETILGYDKDGRFIPLCTKLVFYKMYTSEDNKNKEDYDQTLWNEYDKEDYMKDMESVLKKFFEKERNGKNGK